MFASFLQTPHDLLAFHRAEPRPEQRENYLDLFKAIHLPRIHEGPAVDLLARLSDLAKSNNSSKTLEHFRMSLSNSKR